jgi:hypothetical protein
VALFLCALMSISSALFGSGRVRSSSKFVFCFDPEIWNLKLLDLGAIFGNAQNCVWFFLFVYFQIRLCVMCVRGRGESGQGAAFVFWEAADWLTARHSSRVLLLLPLSCAPVVVFQASQCPGRHHQVRLPTPIPLPPNLPSFKEICLLTTASSRYFMSLTVVECLWDPPLEWVMYDLTFYRCPTTGHYYPCEGDSLVRSPSILG